MKTVESAVVLIVQLALVAAAHADGRTLGEFIAATRGALEVRAEDALVDERVADVKSERAALLPRVSVNADLLRNEYAVDVTIPRGTDEPLTATIQPLHQLDATVELDVPVVDVAAWKQTGAAKQDLQAARATRLTTLVDTQRTVVRAYYQWLSGAAELAAAQAARDADAESLRVLASRRLAGLASDLDVARARAEVGRADQAIADARLTVALATRTLRTYTGLEASAQPPALPSDVSPEPALGAWLATDQESSDVESARAQALAAHEHAAADRWSSAPTIALLARERLTNAVGFGNAATWTVGVTASWQLDLAKPSRAAASRAAETRAATELERTARDVRDRIVDAWNTVEQERAHVDAAVAQADADRVAVDSARSRLDGGQATALDVVLAERDHLESQGALLRARADLAAARALLRLAAGRPL